MAKTAKSGGSGARPPTRDVAAAARALQALNLRKLGATYDQIARECGYGNRGTAFHAVQRELQRTLVHPTEEVRTLESERLDDIYRAMIAKAVRGDVPAAGVCLRIMERRASLLGLDYRPDAPSQAQMVIVGVPADVMEAV